ncbi:cystathionine gamma-synthase [Colletotrichum graminicola]|uniref:Cystathionine gamma-synthase n=1 Tax=Colletotrichum graminicola (strain M1.001 / M2 / FGSC 10212) TaxID=645133 RepID=E3Q616_COLGM|nr:cystathionine gamma-synthase [Colletotrichum graminicola M1.001]EFQ26264.1 cystathionine gamma-synthase [Colletotrichum graminicola M1.001]WDK14067.1 cystathionine gamma-synthase [Colletotrichum graminicola]
MPVLKPSAEWGHCVPPESAYGITTYGPGWDTAIKLRDGDAATIARVVHIYPRFGPFGPVAKTLMAICAKIQTPEGHGALYFTSPASFAAARAHALHPHRKQHILTDEDLGYRCVDIGDVRLYLITYPMSKTPGIIGVWQNPGIGVSIRLAEKLLQGIDSLKEVVVEATNSPPPTDYLPEGEAHGKLKERIAGLLHRAAIYPDKVKVERRDVFLYPTGMAAIFAAHRTVLEYRPGAVAILGVAFHSTVHYLQESSPHGYMHFGPVDAKGLDDFETWLDGEAAAGRDVSYIITEFPSNPLLASIDIGRLKKLAEKHRFILVLDDTLGSFASIDILGESDILVSSLTKSFSGYANVLGGSIVLNPLSPHYSALASLWREQHNELYIDDAEVLLANSEDYLQRTAVLNRNAAAMANHLHTHAKSPSSPIAKVLYPTLLPDYAVYEARLRKPTPDLPEPGAGCLLSIDFESVATARAFYDRLAFYPGPHLGAHRTLSFAYNLLAFGKDPDEAAYHRSYGILEGAVRISAGLEDVQDLLDTLDDALAVAQETKDKLAEGPRTVEAAAGLGVAA